MNKNTLDNLINFCFHFRIVYEYEGKLTTISPDYLLEKWNKYFGVNIIKNTELDYVYLHKSLDILDKSKALLLEWHNVWKGKNYEKTKEIYYFLIDLKSNSIDHFIERFNQISSIKLCDLKVESYDYIHPNLKFAIENWLNIPINKRSYNLNLLI